jgi:Tfp pilus assembly protein PilO
MNKLFSWKTLAKIAVIMLTIAFVVIVFIGFQFLTNGTMSSFLALFK